MKNTKIIILFLVSLFFVKISYTQYITVDENLVPSKNIKTGAEQTDKYFPMLRKKNVAVVANQTSVIKNTHLVDSLIKAGIKVKRIFCPEHGFRGNADAGEHVKNNIDKKTGVPIISLYGKNNKPKPADLKDIDIVVFDLQDVGVRFYTYISTMHYVMEACAENKKPLLILDRPNPNGYYIDGPVLEKAYTSFVGMHPVPIVYGMTIAEYAIMINKEGWLKNSIKCDLKYVELKNYSHNDFYQLPLKPSPNLPNMNAVYLYPSLGLFEGTVISVGRGTELPFQTIGYPGLKNAPYSFIPKSTEGAKNPPYLGTKCNGYNLSNFADIYVKNIRQLYLYWLINTYKNIDNKATYFNEYFDNLAGTSKLRNQIISGKEEEEIRKSWQDDIKKFKIIRRKHLLYPDFE